MNETRARELFVESLKEPLAPADAAALAAFLAANPAVRVELEQLQQVFSALQADASEAPGAGALEALDAAIAAERTAGVHAGPALAPRRGTPQAAALHPRRIAWLGFAAGACLLALAFVAGVRVGQAGNQPAPAVTRDVASVTPAPAGIEAEFVDFDQPAGPVRVEQVLQITDAASVRRALEALASDPSANVRLTVLGALDPRTANPNVRATVLASVGRDPSPIVQIAMIEFISAAGGPEAAPTLAKLARNETVDESVRDAANFALAQL